MKRFIYILTAAIAATCVSCTDIDNNDPYEDDVCNLYVSVLLSDSSKAAGADIDLENILTGSRFAATTSDNGSASFRVTNGIYRLEASFTGGGTLYNGAVERLAVSGKDVSATIPLAKVKTSDLVIKEIYCGGCKMLPFEGNYQSDKYILIHNNSENIVYLDSLCFGIVSPYNSTSINPWTGKDSDGNTTYPDFLPIAEAVWQFRGDGKSFPLESGEDAVIAVNGAIDHSAQFPLSVNLNNEKYFVCYNTTHFPNTTYHPSPGDKIRQDRILNVVIKTGQSSAFPMSLNSPAIAIFRADGMTIQDFVGNAQNVIPIPGSTNRAVCIPFDWVLDAVEVFDGKSSNNLKRMVSTLDGGYVKLSGVYLGHSLIRKVNTEASAEAGFEVLVDTNNSSNDFAEAEKASLHSGKEDARYE